MWIYANRSIKRFFVVTLWKDRVSENQAEQKSNYVIMWIRWYDVMATVTLTNLYIWVYENHVERAFLQYWVCENMKRGLLSFCLQGVHHIIQILTALSLWGSRLKLFPKVISKLTVPRDELLYTASPVSILYLKKDISTKNAYQSIYL